MEEELNIAVDRAEEGSRLDVFLSRHMPLTRSSASKCIEQGRVLVDGRERKPSFKLQEGMRVYARIPVRKEGRTLEPMEIPLRILYEDSSIVVIDKPAGLTVHPGAGEDKGTLVHALIHRYPEIAHVGDPDRPGIVHRLDKLTSGVMVAARSREAWEKLSEAFKEHRHSRIYLAICYGPFGASSGRIETFMQRNPKDRKKMTSRASAGRRAVTNWQVLKDWEGVSLLELSLETGRTHQIRVHLSDMGHPVVGDPEYGGKKRANTVKDPVVRARIKSLGRQMLHARTLGIIHPASGDPMEFSAEPPEDFLGLMSLLDERQP